MKRTIALILIFALAATLCSCGTMERQPEETPTAETTQPPHNGTTETTGPSEELLRAVSCFQGEWQGKYSRVIICNETVNIVTETEIAKKEYVSVHTFYFAFADDGTLVINNQHGQSRKKAEITLDGLLQIVSIGDTDEPDFYEWVSDSTAVPAEKDDPEIGMTELEVYSSSWGYPKSRNKTTTAAGTREQLVYDFGYIYLTNGIVTAIQER